MEKKKTILLLAVLLAASAHAATEGVEIEPYIDDGVTRIEKSAPEAISIGETLTVSILVKNGFNGETAVDILEDFGGAEIIDAGAFKKVGEGDRGGISGDEYYRAVLRVPANSVATITYIIKPKKLGDYYIAPARVRIPTGQTESNPVTVKIMCNQDSVCEAGLGETALNCPVDCKPDKIDELCNKARDRVCDPDCPKGMDPDCVVASTTQTAPATTLSMGRCGNNACDSPEENYGNCPGDCISGSRDGFCDKVSDDRCDPDCAQGEDLDCSRNGGWLLIIVFIVLIALAAYVAYKKKWLRKEE